MWGAGARIGWLGVATISLADTKGVATPRLIGEVFAQMRAENLGVHLHSARATAAEKILAAYDAGCRRFDSAIGGLGGCPFAQAGLVGDIPSATGLGALGERGAADLSTRGPSLPGRPLAYLACSPWRSFSPKVYASSCRPHLCEPTIVRIPPLFKSVSCSATHAVHMFAVLEHCQCA